MFLIDAIKPKVEKKRTKILKETRKYCLNYL